MREMPSLGQMSGDSVLQELLLVPCHRLADLLATLPERGKMQCQAPAEPVAIQPQNTVLNPSYRSAHK